MASGPLCEGIVLKGERLRGKRKGGESNRGREVEEEGGG